MVASTVAVVSPKLFSRVSLLLFSDIILKAINTKTKPRLTWKPKYREKNHDIVVLCYFFMNNRYNEGE